MIIAIDGASGTGKSSTAKVVAERLGLLYLNTGSMYRGITLKALQAKVDSSDEKSLLSLAKATEFAFDSEGELLVDGTNVANQLVSPEVTAKVSDYCQLKSIRTELTEKQRMIGNSRDCILDGRDIGTVVFPNADLKFFMVADYRVRAERRHRELLEKGIEQPVEEIEANLRERDEKDSSRKEAPLVQAEDAELIDTTQLSFEEQVERICIRARVVAGKQMADAKTPESL